MSAFRFSEMFGCLMALSWATCMVPAALAEDVPKAATGTTRALHSSDPVAGKRRAVDIPIDSAVAEKTPKRVALVVGNANYRRIQKLDNPVNDANDVCKELRLLGFDVLCVTDTPTKRELRDVVRTFVSKLGGHSIAFFYYAGHGIQLNGENYLLPTSVDANSSADIEDDGLSLSYLLRSLEDARSAPNIVVLDACRENPFAKLRSAFGTRGLARMEPPVSTMLVYATSPSGVALDGSGRNGLFTKHFIRHLRDPGLKIDELFQVVSKDVEEEAKSYGTEQIPYRSSSYSGAYCLAGCENPRVAAELEQIKLQRDQAAQRISALAQENANLRREAEQRRATISELETKIDEIARESSATGTRNARATAELARLQATLAATRSDQAESEKLKSSVAERQARIVELMAQMTVLQNKADELEKYRREFSALQHQSEEAAKRFESLAEENARLKRQVEERRSLVVSLEDQIKTLTGAATSTAEQRMANNAELAKLQGALDAARARQAEADKAAGVIREREAEIAELRTRMLDLQRQTQQLEDFRRQVFALKEENAQKTRLLNDQATNPQTPRHILVPSF